jgi:putative nucleotidyltransferase with HDIG domain
MGLWARFRSSLTYPIAATLVLVTVVPVALVGMLQASHNRENLTTIEKQNLVRQAVGLASETSLFFSGHRTQLESTVRALERTETFDRPFFERLLQGIAAEPGRAFSYLEVRTVDGDGTYVTSLGASQSTALSDRVQTVHERTLDRGEIVDLEARLPGMESGALLYSFPLRTESGSTWGTFSGAVDLAPLEARLLQDAAGGFLISLIDDQGRVVVSSDPGLRGRSLAASQLVTDFLRRPMRLTQVYEHPVDASAGEVLGSAAPMPDLGWGVVVERPTAQAFATVHAMQRRTLFVTAIAAVLALAIGFAMSRRLIEPIQRLAGASSEIADGNLAVRAAVGGDDELAQLAGNFNHMAGNIETLVRRLKQALRQNQELFLETIRTLAAAIDAKDPYTRGHSERVSAYSMAIARHLGLNQEEVFRVRIAAILHDVGKLGVNDQILNKPGGLSEDEFDMMKKHVEIGAQIMSPIRMLRDIIPGIRNHHETWEGSGYPDKLAGEEIPMVARIIGVSDTFDAMTTTRPYQKAMTLDFVLAKMRSMSGTRFDPQVVDAFLAAVEAGDVTPPPQTVSAEAELRQQEVS